MSQTIQTTQATKKLQQSIKSIKKDMANETKALSKGLFIAMSNASVKKGSGKKPTPGSKKASGENWQEGPELTVTYKVRGIWYTYPARVWFEKLKAKTGRETYTDKNGKTRTKKVSPYNVVAIRNQKKPGVMFEHEVWRKGSQGKLPYSWGNPGLANYYLRKQWRSKVEELMAEVRISPTTFKGESNNERVLKMLDEGGTGKGSRTLKGFILHFRYNKKTHQTDVGITKNITKTYKTVKMKGFHIKRQVLARTNRILRRIRPSQITANQWRKIGSGY